MAIRFDDTGEVIGKPRMDFRGVVSQAMREATARPGTLTRRLGTDPITQAQAFPYLLGAAGQMIPGGMFGGTVGGRQISNLALRTYGRPELIPSGAQQTMEAVLAGAGEFGVPFLKKARYGKEIGEAEKAAGAVTRAAPKAITPGSVGETLNNLEAQIDSGVINTAQGARDAKEIVDQIYMNPRIYEKSPGIKVQAARVSNKVQNLLNTVIPGRAQPAAAMSRAMMIPRTMGRAYQAVPPSVRRGVGTGIGLGLGGGSAYELIRRLIGG